MKQMKIRLLLTLLAALFLVACSPAGETAVDDHHEDNTHNTEGHGEDHAEGNDHGDRIPNNGAVVRIMAPAAGDTFARGDQVVVEIETENFVLGEDGNHWHVFVNDESWGMIMGANQSEVLRGLPPGEHEISVTLSIGTHEDLADGDSVTITVTE
ncbi:MAG: DUF6130 family protein [Chloroflexota bacterium]